LSIIAPGSQSSQTAYLPLFASMLFLLSCDSDPKVPLEEENVEDVDNDGDGFLASEDCDDTDPRVNSQATEICDGIDNNCDGNVDEDVLTTYYLDSDGDGYGNEDSTTAACAPPEGYVPVANDCDDTDPEKYPGSTQLCDELRSSFCSSGGAVSGSNFRGAFCFSPVDAVPAAQSSGASFIWQPGPITAISQ